MDVHQLLGWLNPQTLIRLALRFGANSDFLICQDQRLTRGQVLANVQRLAAGLQALGVGKGDRVATLLPACPEAVYTLLLPWFLGNVNVPLNPLLAEEELRYILADCGAKAVIVNQNWYGQRHADTLTRLLPELPDLRYIIVRDSTDGDGRTCLPMSAVLASSASLRSVVPGPDDTMTLAYTSGTTGLPKGVVHTRRRAWGLAVRDIRSRLAPGSLRCMLLAYPPYHTAGRFGIFIALLTGGKLVLMERFDPQEMLRLIERERVTQIGGSPTMYRLLLGAANVDRHDLSSVRRIAFSSEAMSLDLARALHDRFRCHLENMYGTTETMMISLTGLHDSWQLAAETVGKPAPGVRLRIVDDDRQPVPAGRLGEIAVQTPQMMVGYYQSPELTAQVLDAEGWFYTGDIGYIGNDGYLRLVDRKKDVIIRGGQNIYPAEIERCLEQHPAIRRAAVVGVPSSLAGQALVAYVELQPGARLSAADALNACRGRIAPYKIPRQVVFVPRLPLTAAGKVQKYKLREQAALQTPMETQNEPT